MLYQVADKMCVCVCVSACVCYMRSPTRCVCVCVCVLYQVADSVCLCVRECVSVCVRESACYIADKVRVYHSNKEAGPKKIPKKIPKKMHSCAIPRILGQRCNAYFSLFFLLKGSKVERRTAAGQMHTFFFWCQKGHKWRDAHQRNK